MKRVVVGLSLLALLAGLGVAVWPSSPTAPDAQPIAKAPPRARPAAHPIAAPVIVANGSIAGGVHRAGLGVVGAEVVLKGESAVLTVVTGADGGFAFDDVAPGSYLLSASFGSEASRVLGPFFLSPGEHRQGVALEVLVAASLSGTVVDASSGETIAGATVSSGGKAIVTDHAGRFSLAPVSLGEAWLDVSAKGYIPRTEWVTIDAARRLSGMQVVLVRAATVRGRVLRQGEPVALARVSSERMPGEAMDVGASPPAVTDGAGAYSLDVGAGRVRLFAATEGGARVEGPELTLAPGEVREGVDLELGQELFAAGDVTVDGIPAQADVAIFDAKSGQPTAATRSDAQGHFEARGVSPGRYLVHARTSTVEGQRGPFELTGADDAPWTVELTEEGRIFGKVAPAAAGVVVRARSTEWVGDGAQTLTDAQGRFELRGFGGDATVTASGPSGSAEAHATPGTEVVLNLTPSLLAGLVVDPQGHPVTDFNVRVRPLSGGASHTHPVLSPEGTFRISVPAGRYELSAASAEGGTSDRVEGEASHEGGSIRLVMSSTVSFFGRALDKQTRAPLAGAEAQLRTGHIFDGALFATVKTDADGYFRFSRAPGSGFVVVNAPGHLPRWGPVVPRGGAPDDKAVDLLLDRGDFDPWTAPYEGIGLSWDRRDGNVYVVREVFHGAPAEEAGILPGDVLVSVNGTPAGAVPFDQIISSIRGPAGSVVQLLLSRNGSELPITVRRRAIAW